MNDWRNLLERLLADPLPAAIGGDRVMRDGRRVGVTVFNTRWIEALALDRGLA